MSIFKNRLPPAIAAIVLLAAVNLEAADVPGVDIAVRAKVFNTVRNDATTIEYGTGGGAALAWQWHSHWRTDAGFAGGRGYAGNLGLSYRIFTMEYKRYPLSWQVVYAIVTLFSREYWAGIVCGMNRTENTGLQGGIGLGFSVSSIPFYNISFNYGLNAYLINSGGAFGLGQAFAGLIYRI